MVNIYPYQIRILEQPMSEQAFKRLMDDVFMDDVPPVEDLIISEGTVYGKRYHTVQPVGGVWKNMELWCFDTFGETGTIWGHDMDKAPAPDLRWYMNNSKFWFRNRKDLDWFLLRWRS